VKQFIEHLTGRVVLMKNEHDLSRDFPHTHSIRLPAQESHKQGNQNCCCESKKRVSLQTLHQSRALLLQQAVPSSVPASQARWLLPPAAPSRPHLGSACGPRSAPPPTAGGAAGHAEQRHLSCPRSHAPQHLGSYSSQSLKLPCAKSQEPKTSAYCLRA